MLEQVLIEKVCNFFGTCSSMGFPGPTSERPRRDKHIQKFA